MSAVERPNFVSQDSFLFLNYMIKDDLDRSRGKIGARFGRSTVCLYYMIKEIDFD